MKRDRKHSQKAAIKEEEEADDILQREEEMKQKERKSQKKSRKHDKKHKHKKDKMQGKGKVQRFFEDEAVEGDDSSEEGGHNSRAAHLQQRDQYYDPKELVRKTKGISDKLEDIERRARKGELKRLKRMEGRGDDRTLPASDDDDDDEAIRRGYESIDELEEQMAEARRARLPSTSDPKLWQVKVKRGMERTAAMALLNKSIDFAQRGMPLEILSATCADNVENYIFVEAYRKDSVAEAIAGLNFCLNKIEILPLNEMTKIYENQMGTHQKLPSPGNWIRVKSGLYDRDLGVVEKLVTDDKVCVKLIPRVDPNPGSRPPSRFQKRGFVRAPQRAFNSELFKDASKVKPAGFNKHFYQWRNFIFRKGFLYKTFSIKQVETSDVKPTPEERGQFLDIFEQNASSGRRGDQGEDSSEMDAEETRKFFRADIGRGIGVGDKMRVIEGELQGATGTIQSVEDDQVVFKPNNLEGFTENLGIDRAFVIKYFELGDSVRIIDGKYQGETGLVTDVKNQTPEVKVKGSEACVLHHPVVKLDRSQRELRVNLNNLKLKTDHDKDAQRLIGMEGKGMLRRGGEQGEGETQRVGDVVLFNGSKSFGYILQVQDDFVKVVSDSGIIAKVRLTEIDRSLKFDKKAFTRDSVGNILQIDDVVKCSGEGSLFRGKKGIIKNICKACLFLWDPKDFAQSGGIFAEATRNVLILGTEFLKGSESGSRVIACQNRIIRDKLVNKLVMVIKGEFKGQKGRVTQVNGEEAILELSTRAKKVSMPRADVREIYPEESGGCDGERQVSGSNSVYGHQAGWGGDAGGQSAYRAGQSAYGAGGQTAHYDAGKTPMAFATPAYQPLQTPGGPAGEQWGLGTGGNTGYDANSTSLNHDGSFSRAGTQLANAGQDGAAVGWGQQTDNASETQPLGSQQGWGQGGGETPGGEGAIKREEPQTSEW